MIKNLKNVNILNPFIIIIAFGILIQIIKCDECTNTDDTNCKYSTKNHKYIQCASYEEDKFYYFTTTQSEGEDVIACNVVGENEINYKLIYNTKELVENCSDTGYNYQLGSICYQSKPSNTKLKEGNIYECMYSFTKEIDKKIEYIKCLNKAQNCPSTFDHITYTEGNNIICSKECFNESTTIYKYKEKDEQNKIFYYCLSTQCSSTVKYYYEPESETSKIIECLENCNSLETGGFYNGQKCLNNNEDCSGYIKVDLNKNNFECITTTTTPISCPIDYPYLYTNNSKTYCLKSCLDTQKIPFFGNEKTYLYEENSSKECIASKPDLYKDELALKLTNDCKNSLSGPYHNESDKTCYQSCDNYKNESECVDNCDEPLLTDEETKTCYKQCPSNLGRGFQNETENICQSCNPGEGYYKEEEGNIKKCYLSCNDYHNDGDNFCFKGECNNSLLYKYHTDSGKICYKSCSDIKVESNPETVPKTYTYPYLFEKNNTCYEVDPHIDDTYNYYYITSSNITKYIKEEDILKECFEANLKYLKGNQCISKCSKEDFIILPTQSKLGQCLNLTEVQHNDDCKYYNNTKICSDECQFLEIKNPTDVTPSILNESCVINCPSDYFENVDSKTCEKSCNTVNPFINKFGKCVSKCENGFYKEIEDSTNENTEKRCVDKCKDNDNNKFGYYLEDGKCVDSCLSFSNTSFSYETINDHQPCIKECPSDKPFYNNDTKICLEKCEYYQEGLCVDKCNITNGFIFLQPGNICSKEECKSNAPFKIDFNFNLDGTENQVTKCVSSCTENHFTLYEDSTKKCTNSCSDSNYVIYNGACLASCPQGLYKSGNNCVSKCDKNFYKPDNSDTYECIDSCNVGQFIYTTLSGECKKKCPITENYIDENNNCLNNNTNKFFEDISDDNDEYKIYKLLSECSLSQKGNNLYIYGQKECISDCNKYNLYKLENNICNNTCFYNGVNNFSTIEIVEGEQKKVCNNICHESQPNFEKDLICKQGCNSYSANIINDEDNSCVNQCNINSTYRFLQKKSTDNTLHCQQQCDGDEYRYFNYKCSESCDSINNFIVENTKECLSECPKETPYYRKKIISSVGGSEKYEYECSNTICITEGVDKEYYYYSNDKMCIEECNDYIKENTNICTKSCDVFSEQKYFYETENEKLCILNCTVKDKPYALMNNTCTERCNNGEFYNEYDKICRIKCPINQKIDNYICRENCSTSTNNKYEDENGICVEKCENSKTGYIYYNKDFSNKCQNKCNKYIKGNTCVNSCEEDEINTSSSSITKFIDENICVERCPITKKYIVYNSNPENTENNSPQYKCLPDCPKNYTYYSIITISELTEPVYACKNTCDAYIINNDQNVNARFCFDDGICPENNQYFIDGDDHNKQCLSECPDKKPYYISENTQDIECLTECPDDYAHLPEKYICEPISACETKKINYNKKECVKECPKNFKIFVKDDITYCIENCTILDESITGVENLLLTNDERCVTSCNHETETEIQSNNTCVCRNLFYIDKSTQKIICLSNSITSCEHYDNYPISIVGTKECSYYCDGILSSSGHQCNRNESHNCLENYETLITLNNGDKICDCIEKFYYPYNENGKKEKKCLEKGENCPSSFEFYDIESKECVKNCTDINKIQFEKTCVSFCPESTEKNEETNEYKWYINKDNNKVICLKYDCPEEYPLFINETKQCVSSCIGTGYNIYFNKECVKDCGTKQTNSTEGDSFAKKYAEKKCQCNKIWYYDEISGKEECYDGEGEKDCYSFSDSNLKYKIYTTNQCVSSCNNDFPYEFNNLCFKQCENYTEQDIISQINSEKCICRELTEYIEKNNNKDINCLTLQYCKDNYENYSIVTYLKQCYKIINGKKCPNKYPIYFNGYCYNETTCPDNTEYNPYEQKCNCKYKWYNTTSKIECLSEQGNCPQEYPLLVKTTNECKKSDDDYSNYVKFNSELYLICPENTIQKENSNECICDNKTYWYKDNYNILHCSENKCPTHFPYRNDGDSNKECIAHCEGKYLYLYRGICYEKCPELTEKGNDNECILSPVNNNLTLDNLEETIRSKLVDLYKKSNTYNEFNSTTSQKIVTKEATVEFYGVNKNNKKNSKENIQSDLSYIDISECIEKIYNSNGMGNDDDIIILKFDVNKEVENFLINPVEYKFVNSRTGQELDASVCEHNSIKISYPLHDLINRYDNRKKKKRNLEYMQLDLTSNNKDSLREKLDKGKEINEKYPDVDIFNINDKMYSNICIAVEVDGKDLILQDRFNYFYPQMSLCENNCTYNHTDFVNERIYCDCSFKKEFDFRREYSSSFEIDKEQIKNAQGGNININVMKCISNLKNKKSISGNGGFIFLLIVIIIEFILLLIIIFYGIGSLLNKLKDKMKKDDSEEEDYDKIELNVANTNSNNDKNENEKEKEKEKETQRQLNNPPKKKKEYGMEFIPQEYVFLFFNQNEKGTIKKVERDGVPFKTNYNTRILLEKLKNVNYNNIKSRGPFPPNQNVLVIVDNMNDSISDYIYDDDESDDNNDRIKNTEENKINNKEEDKNKNNSSHNNKHHKKDKKNKSGKIGEKFDQKPKKYSRKKIEFTISDYDPSDENYSEMDFDEDENHEKGFIESIKKEQRLIKKNYETSVQNQKSSNFIIMLFTEIIDKIYITKILLFTRKFDILSLQLSVYILCHTLLLILLALFYDIKTIEKIWNEEEYPGLGYYLLYGFISCIIIWIIYTIILCLWSNNDKIKDLLRIIHVTKKYRINKERTINKKYNNLSWKIKFKVAVYTIIEFLLLAFCFVYFVTFCTVYTGTMDKVFKSYGIALIEVLIIKIIYGIVLAILRKVSLDKEKKTLYNVILFMDTYLV